MMLRVNTYKMYLNRKTRVCRVNLAHSHRPARTKQGQLHLCPHLGSLPSERALLRLPTSSLQVSVLLGMLFLFPVGGTNQDSLLFFNLDEEDIAFPAVPRKNPEIQVA